MKIKNRESKPWIIGVVAHTKQRAQKLRGRTKSCKN